MDTAAKLELGLQTTGLGILVTFIALVMIIVIIYLLSAILKERKKNVPIVPVQPASPQPAVEQPVHNTADDAELVAVLTAAIAASMGTSTNGLVVRSYRKIGSAWANAGRDEQIYNKF